MRLLIFSCLLTLGTAARAGVVDYADARQVDAWLRHPVLGDPSFDAFEHDAAPVHRGSPPYEWPVNGFLFHDPVGGADYLYVGEYARGYVARPSRCVGFRSSDGGKTWQALGKVVQEDPALFGGDGKTVGHLPDVSVVYFDRHYHMVYDWAAKADLSDGGIAYAVADKPEGPFRRDREPILRQGTQEKLLGRYNRPYAATLLRRKDDWLVLGMFDLPPRGWAMWAITAPSPHGPWTKPVLVRNVEGDYFHPPLMEFFPAFTHDSSVYAPATSVARNRDFQCLFRAPLEKAHEASAWVLERHGSLWHSDDVPNEFAGIWGQTFSGFVDDRGEFRVMFPSKTRDDLGTINLARRPWDKPLRPRGFVLSGHGGRAMTLLRQGYADCDLRATARVRGVARLLWDYRAPLGPDTPSSDATLHPLMLTRHAGLELSAAGWQVVRADEAGATKVLGAGTTAVKEWAVSVHRAGGATSVSIDGKAVWSETQSSTRAGGAIGWLVGADSHLDVDQFTVEGTPAAAPRCYLCTEGWLDAAEDPAAWQKVQSPAWRFGVGAESKAAGATAKWSVIGRRLALYSPRGPAYGTIALRLDGGHEKIIDLHADAPAPSAPVWSADHLQGEFHAVVIRRVKGVMPLDCLEVAE